ncbi:HCL554Wp [Eremothecium sinecaudum]|uniref:Glutamate synthase [NADH] n=1 Tax=Eremothecium sinecaudum TaxID=45286 RepID=A0A109UYQ4_9SACH|nr:HCL554Wp [Eremothecium sinecaudum]AMD19597.1 HCL554Wp [Eremothecium sinecaudum]
MLKSEARNDLEDAYEGGTPFLVEDHKTDPTHVSWANAMPGKQGLYDPEYEKDACGVGFVANINGSASHKIVSDAKYLLCNMTHRGAVSTDGNGDGAGILVGIPHEFMQREFKMDLGVEVPPKHQYAVGNVFFKKGEDEISLRESKGTFENIAESLGLKVLGWRGVPHDSSILGSVALSREPIVLQPLVVFRELYEAAPVSDEEFTEKYEVKFRTQLYILRKQTSAAIGLQNGFYVCSLNNRTIVYKGQLTPAQVYNYYHDLTNAHFKSHLALVHSRFSTNTFPSWDRAQPLRWIAHNGEINTLRGNKNWMRAKEGVMASEVFQDQLEKLYPIIEEGGSDSAAMDNVLELLVINGILSLPEAMCLMVPEAYHKDMDSHLKAWFDWAACLMEPWDGPALLTFTDGRYTGATLDRNGLRPCRYYITADGRVICGSEVGVIPVDNKLIVSKGKLKPGDMLLVDTMLGEMIDTKVLKNNFSKRKDFKSWLSKVIKLDDLLNKTKNIIPKDFISNSSSFKVQQDPRLLALGYTYEQVSLLLVPMALTGKEALGSMGNDAPLACLNEDPVLVYEYFRQLFAQVTNPPIDPIREANVMSLECFVGPQGNLLEMHPSQCDRLLLKSPILKWNEFEALKNIEKVHPTWSCANIDITFPRSAGLLGYTDTIERITKEASEAIDQGKNILILSDRKLDAKNVTISSLIAVGAIHHHLIRNKQRSHVAIILETGEAREVHQFCVLLGYGCDGIFPYLAMETLVRMNREGLVRNANDDNAPIDDDTLIENYKHALDGGILKVMSKMGISTLASYKGAQIFEALGVDNSVIDMCFAGTASRIKGVTFEYLAQDAFSLHERGFPSREIVQKSANLPEAGEYHWRDGGYKHVNDPSAIASLQDSVRNKNEDAWELYVKKEMEAIRDCTLRGLLELDYESSTAIPLEQVEPWTEIARRFATGAMSYGSISMEAHSTLAIAMNRLGAKSNCGEGGEDAQRSIVHANGDTMRSAIKQVASARFGVTSHYLSDADEIQIKVAQGAKPGEGGELPAHKVSVDIAKTRHSTPYVGLISPPPHHDIYSIEDLKQLIYDLKCANPRAGISVKLVSEVGVGIVASGVAKAKADHILVSGHDGGTGAARWTSVKYAGLPWELGLAETHQTLVLNDLRRNVVVQTDGQLRTGFDIAVAILLGAESFTLATIPLIAMGCVMLRKCHLNACAVGIATQDPYLRSKFKGQPEHVINFFYYLIQDLRKIMAKLGYRTVDEMVGHSEKLRKRDDVTTKALNIDLSPILTPAHLIRPGVPTSFCRKQDLRLHTRLDNKLIDEAEITLDKGLPVTIDAAIINTDRALGSTLSYRVSKRFGENGLPQDTIVVNIEGSAGQSFGAFLASGITFILDGDANDYVGKGLSGGKIVIRPPEDSKFKSDENVIIGNTCFYGATSGRAFIAGSVGERFAVRNSGATLVVERIKGNNAFEYMTGGRAVVLSQMESLNAFSGATGGIAYCLTSDYDDFIGKINLETIELQSLSDPVEVAFVKNLIQDHYNYTKSELASRILRHFNHYLKYFVKVIPTDYKKVLDKEAAESSKAKERSTAEFLKKFNGIKDTSADATNGELQELATAKKQKINSKTISINSIIKEPKVIDLEDSVQSKEQIESQAEKLDRVKGFMKYKLSHDEYRKVSTRVRDWKELSGPISKKTAKVQTARCMDCGVPFCTSDTGCPISNVIPKFNELVFKNQWKLALDKLLETNNFPEFTGRVCPAPCQGACTLGIIDDAVGIKSVERIIIDNAFKEGWITPCPPEVRTQRTVAIIGSGPAGLACADQLNRSGHSVTVYERADRFGGLLMYGIPNMKLDKSIVQRRIDLLEAEGIEFVPNTEIGKDITVEELKKNFDAVVFAIGSTVPRDLRIPGRELKNIDFAMTLLSKNTKALLEKDLETVRKEIEGKKVIVIGGGDTGNDCLGTSVRHGAASVLNFELLPQPPNERAKDNPWPQWPRIMRVDYGHAEVKERYGRDPREFCILSKEFIGNENGEVTAIKTVRVEWKKSQSGVWQMVEIPGSEKTFEADIVLLSMGFVGPELMCDPSLKKTKRGNIATISESSYCVDGGKVFAAGDCRRGQSLIVWAIQEGRKCATAVDVFLIGSSNLPGNGGIVKRDYRLLEELASAF